MNINDAKNFKMKNIIIRAVSFVVYFFVSGFAGKLITLFIDPIVKFFTQGNPELEIAVLYLAGVAVMFAFLSFFSAREGYNDTILLKFSPLRTIFSYIAASLIFLTVCLILYYTGYANCIGNDNSIVEYFFKPYFISSDAVEFLKNININGDYFLFDFFDSLSIYIEENIFFLLLTIFLCTAFTSVFYVFGRKFQIREEKKIIKRNAEAEMEMAIKMAIGTNTAAEEDIDINTDNKDKTENKEKNKTERFNKLI